MIKNLEYRKKKGGDGRELHSENAHSAGAARRGDRDYAAGRALRRMEALNARKNENSSCAPEAGENSDYIHFAIFTRK